MDRNAPLAPGHPHQLPAVGALEVAVLLVVGPGPEAGPRAPHGPYNLKEAGVFPPPPLQVPGQGAVQAEQDERQHDQMQDHPACEQGDYVQHHIQRKQKYIKLVAALAARHEARDPTSDHQRSPPDRERFLGNITNITRTFELVNGITVNKM